MGMPCTVTVTQPPSLEADVVSSNITIPCSFSTNGCPGSPPTVLWFRYLADTHEDLCMPKCTQSKKFQVTGTVPEKQASLQIINANTEDSAIYFCGVAFADSADPLSKQTGGGTALTIRGWWLFWTSTHTAVLIRMCTAPPLSQVHLSLAVLCAPTLPPSTVAQKSQPDLS